MSQSIPFSRPVYCFSDKQMINEAMKYTGEDVPCSQNSSEALTRAN